MPVVTWETATDWDAAQSEQGVVHEAVTNTDHDDATIIKQGYSASSPFKSADLIRYYPLHEDSGSTANDFGGNNDGTISGDPVLGSTGLLGTTAYVLDGVGDEIEAADTSPSNVTVVVWLKPDFANFSHTGAWVVAEDDPFGNNNGYYLEVTTDGVLRGHIGDGSNRQSASSSTGVVSDGAWGNMAFTYDGSDILVYLDGSQVASTTGVNATISYASNTFKVGTRANTGNNYYAGTIADVRVYNTALTGSEIATLYDVVNTNGALTTAAKTS